MGHLPWVVGPRWRWRRRRRRGRRWRWLRRKRGRRRRAYRRRRRRRLGRRLGRRGWRCRWRRRLGRRRRRRRWIALEGVLRPRTVAARRIIFAHVVPGGLGHKVGNGTGQRVALKVVAIATDLAERHTAIVSAGRWRRRRHPCAWALPVTVVTADSVVLSAAHGKLSAHALHACKLAVFAALRLAARLKRLGADDRCRGWRRW